MIVPYINALIHAVESHPEGWKAASPSGRYLRRLLSSIQRGEVVALLAFKEFRSMSVDSADLSTSVAHAVGAHARRKGMSEKTLVTWLQSAYSSIFVRLNALDPGLDARDVRKAHLRAFSIRR